MFVNDVFLYVSKHRGVFFVIFLTKSSLILFLKSWNTSIDSSYPIEFKFFSSLFKKITLAPLFSSYQSKYHLHTRIPA